MSQAKQEDIIVWADESWCFRYELHEHQHKSDDYQVIAEESEGWFAFLNT